MKKNHSNLYFIYALILLLTGLPVFAESKKCIYCAGTYIPLGLAVLTRNVISLIQVLVPVILIITGMVSLLRAVIAGDEKKMDEVKPKLIRKFIAGVIIFLIFTIVKFGFSMLGNYRGSESVMKCASLFISEEGNETYCPERVQNSNDSSSSTNIDTNYSNAVKSCADYTNSSDCNGRGYDCEWGYFGSSTAYCRYKKDQSGALIGSQECINQKNSTDCKAAGCSWGYFNSSELHCEK